MTRSPVSRADARPLASVREMTRDDVAAVHDVELAAGARFRSVPDLRIARCADDEPFTTDEVTAYVRAGHAWVAVVDDAVVGFVVVDVLDGCAHVEEIAVVPEHGGRGIGTALVEHVAAWAASQRLHAITLTTFRDVPWNRPWYERLGFRVLREDELTPGLRDVRAGEEAHGLPAELRVVMRRDVTAPALPGQETLVASWRALAQTSPGARVVVSPDVVVAVFPSWAPLNNVLVLDGTANTAADHVASTYADAGVDAWALWIPSPAADLDAPDVLRDVDGLVRDTTTLVMHAALDSDLRSHDDVVKTSIETATRASDEPVPAAELGDPDAVPGLGGWVMVQDGLAVVGAWTMRHGDDCGIYAVGTVPAWRRRGLAAALVEHVLADARRDGACTATLQSTPMGVPLYRSLGFEPAGRYEEWVRPT